jgi:glyoxylase-like metal-dependent hydrolase (beta-lactamase superfamily II)
MKPVKIGAVSVSSIIEREGPWRAPATMFPTATPEKLAEVMSLVPDFAYDRAKDLLCITYQTFVLRTPQCTALIDTCVGEHQRRPPALLFDKKPWLDGFAQHGLKFEDIDYVFCTHLHVDHVGWNTRLRDGRLVPTFPNAKYVFSKREYEHWKQATDPGFAAIHEDCVQPIVDAGQALLVDDAYVLSDELSLVPTPGHSPGHVCINLKSGGERALFTGDMMHHCAQVIQPDWSSCFCYDVKESAATRWKFFREHSKTDTLIIPTHFPDTTAGHIEPFRDAFRYAFLAP